MANSSPQGQRTSRVILAVVGVLVLSALGFFASKYFRSVEERDEYNDRIEKLTEEVLDLEHQIRSFELETKEQKLSLTDRQAMVDALIDKTEIASAELKEMEAKKDEKIGRLLNQVTSIRAELAEKEEALRILQARYDSLQLYTEDLQSSYDSLSDVNVETQDQLADNQELTQQVIKEASVLNVADFSFIHVTKRGKEKDLRQTRVKTMFRFKTCVTILPNTVASTGNRTLYMVFEGPDKKLITNGAGGYSGTFRYGRNQRAYTAKSPVNFKGPRQQVCFELKPTEGYKFERGEYLVRIYDAKGNLIGADSFDN